MRLRNTFNSIYYFSKISVQSLGLLAKAKYRHSKAKTIFKKTLISSGIPTDVANEISKQYPNPISEIFKLIRR